MKARDIRNILSTVARKTHFLQYLDWIGYMYAKASTFARNRHFIMENPGFPVPPPHLAFDAYNSILWDEYYQSGLKVAEFLAELLRTYLDMLDMQKLKVLEWGCGPARIIRHLTKVLGHDAHLYGSDYNIETITGCRENIEGVTFIKNKLVL